MTSDETQWFARSNPDRMQRPRSNRLFSRQVASTDCDVIAPGQITSDTKSTAANQTSASAPPAINLPKSGGAIRGMGENFAANPVTGTGSMSVPIATSPGRGEFGPPLSPTYDSGAGNGPFGFGWNLSLPSITRKTEKGLPQYLDTDESHVFVLSGAEDLVPVLGNINGQRTVNHIDYRVERYGPRIEGLFARIERRTNQLDPADSFLRSISRDNITTWYGRTLESRIADPADRSRIFSWLICESYDDKGNVIFYGYNPEDSLNVDPSQAHDANRTDEGRAANRYLKRIRYGNRAPYFPELTPDAPWPVPTGDDQWLFEVVLDYGEHDLETPTRDRARIPARLLRLPESTERIPQFSCRPFATAGIVQTLLADSSVSTDELPRSGR